MRETIEETKDTGQQPRAPIRRFGVFAEYNRLRGLQRGLDEAHAKGYGLWVAKVVASGGGRHGGAKPAAERGEPGERAEQPRPEDQGWQAHGAQPNDGKHSYETLRISQFTRPASRTMSASCSGPTRMTRSSSVAASPV
jgi:hypothetical protein